MIDVLDYPIHKASSVLFVIFHVFAVITWIMGIICCTAFLTVTDFSPAFTFAKVLTALGLLLISLVAGFILCAFAQFLRYLAVIAEATCRPVTKIV